MSMRDRISEIILTYDDTEALHLVHPDGYCEGCKDTPCIDNSNLRLTDAIIAALPEMIPDLVWKEGCGLDMVAHTKRIIGRRPYMLFFEGEKYTLQIGMTTLDHFSTLDNAKAAANAHHRDSIMAAFTGDTT
jgi:hypothetical protein